MSSTAANHPLDIRLTPLDNRYHQVRLIYQSLENMEAPYVGFVNTAADYLKVLKNHQKEVLKRLGVTILQEGITIDQWARQHPYTVVLANLSATSFTLRKAVFFTVSLFTLTCTISYRDKNWEEIKQKIAEFSALDDENRPKPADFQQKLDSFIADAEHDGIKIGAGFPSKSPGEKLEIYLMQYDEHSYPSLWYCIGNTASAIVDDTYSKVKERAMIKIAALRANRFIEELFRDKKHSPVQATVEEEKGCITLSLYNKPFECIAFNADLSQEQLSTEVLLAITKKKMEALQQRKEILEWLKTAALPRYKVTLADLDQPFSPFEVTCPILRTTKQVRTLEELRAVVGHLQEL